MGEASPPESPPRKSTPPESKPAESLPFSESDLEPPPEVLERVLARPREDRLLSNLRAYVRLLLEANRRHNLTGDRTPELQWRRHVEDALIAAEFVEASIGPPSPGMRILDVGSGGGVPGLLWAIFWPMTRVTLLESVGKKTTFLRETAKALGLSRVTVVQARAEELGHDPEHRERYALVTARALAPLPVLAEWTLPFVRRDGRLLAIKGASVDEELWSATNAFRRLGAPRPPESLAYARSDGGGGRLLLFQKVAPTPPEFPRAPGVAERKPL